MENKTYSYYKTYSYKKYNDMLKMSNKLNKINPYTDEQFKEDLKKWFIETKTIHNDELDELDKLIEHLISETLKKKVLTKIL
jgi:fructose-1,6-bisphosphatase/inositol monophosphatase family enzyme